MAQLPVLYSFRRCPYAMRARMAVAVSGRICELREVMLRNKPQALVDASPKATVPVLVDVDGRVIAESLDIMLWALAQHDPDAWLAPSHGDVSAMLALIDDCDGEFKTRLDRYKYPQRHGDADGGEHRALAAGWLESLDARLHDSLFLFGRHAALADMAIVPFIRQFAHTDMDWFAAQPWPKLQAWLAAWASSPLFGRIMHKYPPWDPVAPGVRFPPPC